MKTKKTRVVITIKDTKEGYAATVVFEPKVSDKVLIESLSPAQCAGYRLSAVIKGTGQDLGKPLAERLHPDHLGHGEESRIIRP